AIDDELPAHVDSAAGNQALARAIISERAPGQTPQPAQDVEPAPPQPPASEASAAIGVDAGDAAAPSPPASEDKTTQTEGRISI
ncbi:hypothetical protein, partial [Klebsiella variicola]|uniref:hypothetical protein n=1 Tax=Klebsiella variicola TaxID=244366 RepID=UPI002731FB94